MEPGGVGSSTNWRFPKLPQREFTRMNFVSDLCSSIPAHRANVESPAPVLHRRSLVKGMIPEPGDGW